MVVLSLLVACGGSGDDGGSDLTCDDLGADQTLDGTVAAEHDACVVSDTVASSDTLTSYIARITPIGPRARLLHERCYGVEDNGVYDRVAHSYDMTESDWTQDDRIFDENGSIVWLATSSHANSCSDEDDVCDTCCAQYCCAGEPVSGSGTGEPVPLRDCVLVSEQ
jgi:hypothetical protein